MSDRPPIIEISGVQGRTLPNGDTLTFGRAHDFDGVWMRYWPAGDPDALPYRMEDLSYDEYEEYRQQHPELKMPELKPPPPATNPQGNTQGRVNGEAPATGKSADDANTEVESETPKEDDTGNKLLDGIQMGLDVVGLIPVAGEIADLANAGVSLARGDYVGAGLSLLSAIPFVGWAGTTGKAARYGTKAALEASEKAAKEAAERAAKEAANKAAKEAAKKKAKEEAAKKKASGAKGKGKKKKDPCVAIQDGVPGDGYRGGRHSSIKKGGNSYTPPRESHHMPADSAYTSINGKPVSSGSKPTIQMDKADHERTASWGSSHASQAYRNRQSSIIRQGKRGYQMAMMMDIADIRAKFGAKYDEAIAQMLAWAKCKGYI